MPRSFWTNTLHSLFSFTSFNSHKQKPHSFTSSGLRFFTEPELPTPSNIVESVSVKRDWSTLEILGSSSAGSVMESMSSYTESLGFESSDELKQPQQGKQTTTTTSRRGNKVSWTDSRSEEVKNGIYPPPLSSLNWNGRPTSYLKSERKHGRLVIKQVTLNRPQLLRASRQNGRLRLYLHEPVPNHVSKDSAAEDVKNSVQESTDKDKGEEEKERVSGTLRSVVRKDGYFGRCCHRSTHNQLPIWSSHRVDSVF